MKEEGMVALRDKTVIIIGASRGIGRDMAVALGAAGANVVVGARSEVVTDPRLPGTIYTVAKEVEERGGRALPVKVDITRDEDLENVMARAREVFGRIDALINNAAILIPGNAVTVQPRHLDLIWRVNLRGPVMAMRAVIPHLREAGGGHILNISSRAGVFPGPGPYPPEVTARARGGAFYAMVKAGLERYSQGLAIELQQDRIAVNVLSPQGRIKTPGNIFAQNDRDNPDLDFEEAVAMGKAARWILEQEPSSFTGNILFDEEMVAKYGL
jgi:citronellol/citronellal dehydrogenase